MFPDRVVGVFPEGTSYTEPCIIQVKEGAAWVALEYSRWLRESGDQDGLPIKIIPVGIAYTDKTQYLSRVSVDQTVFLQLTVTNRGFGRSMCSRFLCERNVSSANPCKSYGEPLALADLEDEYHSAIESGDNQRVRAVVAELTARIRNEVATLSVNAPNWYAVVLSGSSYLNA